MTGFTERRSNRDYSACNVQSNMPMRATVLNRTASASTQQCKRAVTHVKPNICADASFRKATTRQFLEHMIIRTIGTVTVDPMSTVHMPDVGNDPLSASAAGRASKAFHPDTTQRIHTHLIDRVNRALNMKAIMNNHMPIEVLWHSPPTEQKLKGPAISFLTQPTHQQRYFLNHPAVVKQGSSVTH